jgi:hypothetical protein
MSKVYYASISILFTECNHTKIKELRDSLLHKINRVVKARLGETHNIPKYFVKTSYTNKQNSINTNK